MARLVAPKSGAPRTSDDLREQKARIGNLEADTAQKLQAIENAKWPIIIGFMTAGAAVCAAAAALANLFFAQHAAGYAAGPVNLFLTLHALSVI